MRALVTGANRGIGLALCQVLHGRGDEVIAVCRRASPELERLGARIEAGVDVTSDAAVTSLARRLAGVPLDAAVLVAGVLRDDDLATVELAAVEEQIQVNAIGQLRVARALVPNLGSGSRLALITSRMGSIGDNSSGGYYGYRMSKAALNAAGVSLAHDLRGRGIAVAILHPGFVRTDMTGNQGGIAPSESAAQLLTRIDALNLENSGTFWNAKGEILPW